MVKDGINYIIQSISVAIFMTILFVAYINVVVICVPPPEGIREEIVESITRIKEIVSNATIPQDMFVYMIKNGLYTMLYVFIPIIGLINYIEIVTRYAWLIAINSHTNSDAINSLLVLMSTPTLYLHLLSYSLIMLEGNRILLDIVKKRYYFRVWFYHLFTMTIAISIMLLSIVLEVLLTFF
ncbi:MAG: hypothetical protein QW101_02130 [Ignisphaera sp.]|uniref:Stage II sporulation protein M n=1 Tax=Ignisphaera aggregans TaxID=334771 RepID=A0A7J3MYH7_9CREN